MTQWGGEDDSKGNPVKEDNLNKFNNYQLSQENELAQENNNEFPDDYELTDEVKSFHR